MESLIKYFDIKHDFKNIIQIEEKSGDTVTTSSISKSQMLNVFCTNVLEYYYKNDIPLDYSDISVSDEIKDNIIKKVYPIIYQAKSMKMFDLMDFMFKTLKKILLKIHKGYTLWMEQPDVTYLSFNMLIMPNIDILFYIIFINVFPEELKDILRRELRISPLEYKILSRCAGILIKNNQKICNLRTSEKSLASSPISLSSNIMFDSIKDKSKPLISMEQLSPTKKPKSNLYLDTPDGILMILKLFNDLRGFNARRRSKV